LQVFNRPIENLRSTTSLRRLGQKGLEVWRVTLTTYRLLLTVLCAAAAFVSPVVFLEDRPKATYLLGGVGAALLTWLFHQVSLVVEAQLRPGLQAILGAGSAVFSWLTVTLVAIFKVIPHAFQNGLALFDPVWILGGLAPLVFLLVGALRSLRQGADVWSRLVSALFRFSVPLFALQLTVELLPLPKQFRWLTLFTGMMFLVLNALYQEAEDPPSAQD